MYEYCRDDPKYVPGTSTVYLGTRYEYPLSKYRTYGVDKYVEVHYALFNWTTFRAWTTGYCTSTGMRCTLPVRGTGTSTEFRVSAEHYE